MKTRCYPFKQESLHRIQIDDKSEKMGIIIDVVFYGIIGVMFVAGSINLHGIIKMAAATGTSRAVKYLMKA